MEFRIHTDGPAERLATRDLRLLPPRGHKPRDVFPRAGGAPRYSGLWRLRRARWTAAMMHRCLWIIRDRNCTPTKQGERASASYQPSITLAAGCEIARGGALPGVDVRIRVLTVPVRDKLIRTSDFGLRGRGHLPFCACHLRLACICRRPVASRRQDADQETGREAELRPPSEPATCRRRKSRRVMSVTAVGRTPLGDRPHEDDGRSARCEQAPIVLPAGRWFVHTVSK